MTKLTDAQLCALIRDAESWAPDADSSLVEDTMRRAWAIIEADPFGIAPIAFVGALLRIGFDAEAIDAVLRITEHLVASMAEWQPEDEGTERYDA